MAEGDTILRAARRLEPLEGETVAASAPNPRGRAARIERLDGKRLERISSHGKNLLFHFGDLVLHSHMGMNGSWHLYPRGARWRKPRRSAWAVLAGERQEAVQFGGPTLRVLTPPAPRRDPQLPRLGPDILADDFDPEAVIAALRADPDRSLGDALLDQTLVAGIGNIFKSEACFAARLDPWRPIGGLSDEELRAVLAAAREQMLAAVVSGRHTYAVYRAPPPLPQLRQPRPLARPGRRQPHHLLVPPVPGVIRLALECKWPAEAGHLRKPREGRCSVGPQDRLVNVAPPEGIEPSLPKVRSWRPASTGGGYRRSAASQRYRPKFRFSEPISCQFSSANVSPRSGGANPRLQSDHRPTTRSPASPSTARWTGCGDCRCSPTARWPVSGPS